MQSGHAVHSTIHRLHASLYRPSNHLNRSIKAFGIARIIETCVSNGNTQITMQC